MQQFITNISKNIAIAIIDDKLYNKINTITKIKESNPKPRYMENLITIADNLANYFRILLKDNPRKFREEFRKFEK